LQAMQLGAVKRLGGFESGLEPEDPVVSRFGAS
jgi:hypothetical protein